MSALITVVWLVAAHAMWVYAEARAARLSRELQQARHDRETIRAQSALDRADAKERIRELATDRAQLRRELWEAKLDAMRARKG